MRSIGLYVLIVAVGLFSLVNVAVAQDGRKLFATLTGASEIPGPGDQDGSGRAIITLNQGKGEVCFSMTVSNIAPATLAHIHEGATGVAGPPVVTLTETGALSGCVSGVDKELIKRIRQNPEAFYVNVHNSDFPDGAIRGQLSKK